MDADYYIKKFDKIYSDGISEVPLILDAASKGDIETVKILLEIGVDVNFCTQDGETPLILAAGYGHHEIVELLIKEGANINAFDTIKQTALVSAAESGHWKVVKTLVLAGADINMKNAWQHSPLILALFYLNARNQYGLENMGVECYRNYCKIITFLVQHHLIESEVEKPFGIEEVPYLSDFWDECQAEVKKMSSYMLGDSTVSVQKLLLEKNCDRVAGYLSNFSEPWIDWEKEFPHYCILLKKHVARAMERANWVYRADIVMRHCNLDILPPEIRMEVVKYLDSSTDLKNLIHSSGHLS